MEEYNSLRFDGKYEYVEIQNKTEKHLVGDLIFSILDFDTTPLLEKVDDVYNEILGIPKESLSIVKRMENPNRSPYYIVAKLYNQLNTELKKSYSILYYLFSSQSIDFFHYHFFQSHIKANFHEQGSEFYKLYDQKRAAAITDDQLSVMQKFAMYSIYSRTLLQFCKEYPYYSEATFSNAVIKNDIIESSEVDLVRTTKYFVIYIRQSLKEIEEFKKDIEKLLYCVLDLDGCNTRYNAYNRYLILKDSKDFDDICSYYEKSNSQIHTRNISAKKEFKISYFSENICSLAFFEFQYMVSNNFYVRKCANCGKYFYPSTSADIYCDRIVESETDKTCKDIDPLSKSNIDNVYNECRNEYHKNANAYNMSCKRYPHSYQRKDYDEWRKYGNELLKKVEKGELNIDEFKKKIEFARKNGVPQS